MKNPGKQTSSILSCEENDSRLILISGYLNEQMNNKTKAMLDTVQPPSMYSVCYVPGIISFLKLQTTRSCLGVDVHLGRPAAMPCREQNTAATALVSDVLEAVHHVRDAAQTAETAEAQGPGAISC